MRNLKRALSLALASVMLLGMMVVGSSAASYPDVDDNDNVEAIEVLNAVKVMIGDHGSFNPDKAVNRHEMAVIMAKLYLGSEEADNYVGSHPFTDVYPWADKYVAACYENGLVSGTSKTTFGGSQPLTAIQAAAMMLRALGYEKLSEGASDWRTPVAAKANQVRLFKDVVSSPNVQLNRNQVAQLALNTLKADVVNTTSGSSINLGEIGTITTDIKYETVDYTTERGNYAGSDLTKDGYGRQQLCEKLYGTDLKMSDSTDDFGRPAVRWTYKADEVGKYANEADATYTKEVKSKDLYSDLGLSETTAASVVVDGKDAADFSIAKSSETKIGGNGVLVEAYKADDGDVTLTVINPYVGEITRVTPAKDNDERTVTVNGKKYETESFEEDDIVVYTVADGDIKSMYLAETVSDVEVTRAKNNSSDTDNDEFVAAGSTYKYAVIWDDDGSKTALVDDKGDVKKENRLDLYLDQYGYVVKVDLSEGSTDYAYVLDTDLDDGKLFSSGTPYAKLLLSDGTEVEAELDFDDYEIAETKDALGKKFKGMIVEYSKDSKNVYELEVMQNGSGDSAADAKTKALEADQKIVIDSGKAKMTLGTNTIYADSKTVFLTDDGDDNYKAYVGYDAVPDLEGVYNSTASANPAYAYYCESGSVADVVYILNIDASTDDIVFLLTSECSGKITDKDGDDYYECPAVVNGEIVDVKLNKSVKSSENMILLKSIVYDNADEEIIDINKSKVYDTDSDEDNYYITGTVTKKLTNGNLTIAGVSYGVASDAQVFVYDDEIESSSRTGVAAGDFGYFVINDGRIVSIFYKEGDGDDDGDGLDPSDVHVQGSIDDGFIVTTNKSATNYELAQAIEAYLKAEGISGLEKVSVANGDDGKVATITYVDGSEDNAVVNPISGEGAATAAKVMDKVQTAIDNAKDEADKPNPELVTVTVEGNTLKVEAKSGKGTEYFSTNKGSPATHDLARFLGKLKGEGAKEIVYGKDDTVYTWVADNEISKDSKSKWFNAEAESGKGQTLVGAIIADFKSSASSGSTITFTVDGAEMNIEFSIAK